MENKICMEHWLKGVERLQLLRGSPIQRPQKKGGGGQLPN